MSSETAKQVGRRQARRQALFLLYQWDLTEQPLATLFEGEPDAFASELAGAVSSEAPALDARITAAASSDANASGSPSKSVARGCSVRSHW